MLRPALVLSILALALALVACSPQPAFVPPDVQRAWLQYREEPTADTFLRFIHANRAAARAHAHTDDPQGVTHQLLALEAQSEYAERTQDLNLAQAALARMDEIVDGGILDTYEEVLPGFRERLLTARARVAGMLQ